MLKILQLCVICVGIVIVVIISPQTPTENIVLKLLVDTGIFISYGEAKSFLRYLTWGLIFLFLTLTLLLNIL